MGRPRRVSVEDVLRLRQAGRTAPQIAGELACSRDRVLEILHENGIRGRNRSFAVEKQQLLELWDTPRTLGEIGAQLGCSTTTVLRLQKQHALPRRECVRPPPDEAVSPEEDAASADSLAFSPWVAARIKELRLGMPT